jgi:uncharacterized membrane protein
MNTDTTLARFENFTDAVMAIAITLLAIELHFPVIESSSSPLSTIVQSILPVILPYVLSFLTIAVFWVNHHRLTQHITKLTRSVIWTNIGFLMCISLIPFATKVISETFALSPDNPVPVTMYCLVLCFCSAFFSLLRYAIHKNSFTPYEKVRGYVGPIIYGAASILSISYTPVAYMLCIIPFIYYFFPKTQSN